MSKKIKNPSKNTETVLAKQTDIKESVPMNDIPDELVREIFDEHLKNTDIFKDIALNKPNENTHIGYYNALKAISEQRKSIKSVLQNNKSDLGKKIPKLYIGINTSVPNVRTSEFNSICDYFSMVIDSPYNTKKESIEIVNNFIGFGKSIKLVLNKNTLYITPYCLFPTDESGNIINVLKKDALSVSVHSDRKTWYYWDGKLPFGTKVISTHWEHERKDGTRDLRYKENKPRYVIETSVIEFYAEGEWLTVTVSSNNAAKSLVKSLNVFVKSTTDEDLGSLRINSLMALLKACDKSKETANLIKSMEKEMSRNPRQVQMTDYLRVISLNDILKKTMYSLKTDYSKAKQLMKNENINSLTVAADIFSYMPYYKDSAECLEKCSVLLTYLKAKSEMEKDTVKELENAVNLFSQVRDYRDSADNLEKCEKRLTYLRAKNRLQGGTVDSLKAAIELFSKTENYMDSAEQAEKCRQMIYDKACEKTESAKNTKNADEYQKAAEIFDWLGDFKDSPKQKKYAEKCKKHIESAWIRNIFYTLLTIIILLVLIGLCFYLIAGDNSLLMLIFSLFFIL